MTEIITIGGLSLLLGINIGVCLGYIWCLKHKRKHKDNTPVATQAPEPEQQPVEDVKDNRTASFWSQSADSME